MCIVLELNQFHISIFVSHIHTHKISHSLFFSSLSSLLYSLCLFLYDQCLFYVWLGGIYGNIGMGAGGNTFFPGNIANLLTQSKSLLLLLMLLFFIPNLFMILKKTTSLCFPELMKFYYFLFFKFLIESIIKLCRLNFYVFKDFP